MVTPPARIPIGTIDHGYREGVRVGLEWDPSDGQVYATCAGEEDVACEDVSAPTYAEAVQRAKSAWSGAWHLQLSDE